MKDNNTIVKTVRLHRLTMRWLKDMVPRARAVITDRHVSVSWVIRECIKQAGPAMEARFPPL